MGNPQSPIPNLHCDMDMVSYPTVSVNPAAIALTTSGDKLIEAMLVSIVEKQWLSIVAA